MRGRAFLVVLAGLTVLVAVGRTLGPTLRTTVSAPATSGQSRAGVTTTGVRALDGDSFVARLEGREQQVRVFGVDAPERHQPFATVSRKRLAELVEGSELVLEVVDRDRHGRLVARVRSSRVAGGSSDVGQILLAEGLAWHFTRYSKDVAYTAAEQLARERGLGLWRDADPVPPWEWRQQHPPRGGGGGST